MERDKIMLDEASIPDKWYNIHADVDLPPPIHPATHEPITPEDLSVIFPKELIAQEMSKERWIPVPDEVRDIYRIWRPTPLYRARR
ncbi:MAG: TrpB-like pyridoxal-phosphate dependent enzyme, partial [Thermoplasmata archaeon]